MNNPCRCGIEFTIDDRQKPILFDAGDTVVRVVDKDYNQLINKPSINGVELVGDLTSEQLHIPDIVAITNEEIEEILSNVFD